MSEAGGTFPCLLVDGHVYPVGPLLDAATGATAFTMLDVLDKWGDCWPRLERAAATLRGAPSNDALCLDTLRVVAPVSPRQIICAGANYRKHVLDIMMDHDAGSDAGLDPVERRGRAEATMNHRATHGAPFAFIKPVSAVLGPYEDLTIPADSVQTDWELELAVVIARPTRRVSRDKALAHVAGYTIANDITARDHIARRDIPAIGLDWIAGKSAPGFLPLGPFIVPANYAPAPQDMMITLKLNGEVMQHESTADMIFPVAHLIEFVSTYMQLLPGDMICTGSPAGNGTHFSRFLGAGDVIEGAIEGLGSQRNRCVAEQVDEAATMHQPFIALDIP